MALEIEENEPAALNRLLEKLYAEVYYKNGRDYEPASLNVMIAAVHRCLKENNIHWQSSKNGNSTHGSRS